MGIEDFVVNDENESEMDLIRSTQGEPFFKKGKEAPHKDGINYIAQWENYADGIAIAARRHARALRNSGIPLFLQSENYTHTNLGVSTFADHRDIPKIVLKEVEDIIEPKHKNACLLIRHTLPVLHMLESIVFPRATRFIEDKSFLDTLRNRTVLFSAYEEDKIPERRAKLMNMLGQLWTTSQSGRDALVRSGVDEIKVKVVNHPFYGKDPIANVERSSPAGRPFRFLNISKWESRKAQHELMGAFLDAFTPDDGVELIMKVNSFSTPKGYPKDWEESLDIWTSRMTDKWTKGLALSKIRLIVDKRLTRRELAELYAQSDVYVSAGRAEGFDLPAFDAKLSGMRLVTADNGGTRDFRTPGDITVEGVRTAFDVWYGFEEATWCGYLVKDMTAALQRAFSERAESEPLNRDRFTMRYIGQLMREACEEIAPELRGVNADG